jgi:HK97 family phage major capsid protein/HK97 family phage prohead protease
MIQEVRQATVTAPAEGRTVVGTAVVFNSVYDMGAFTESVSSTAFADLYNQDVRALKNHEPNLILARHKQGKGTLKLTTDARGLHYEFELPNTSLGNDTAEELKRGDISQSSWAWNPNDMRDEWDFKGDKPHRTITHIGQLLDVSLVTYPANADTTVALRSLAQAKETLILNNPTMENNAPAAPAATAPAAPAATEQRTDRFVDASAVRNGFNNKEKRDFAKFNPVKLVNELMRHGKLTGLEAELNQEGINEAKRYGGAEKEGLAFHMPVGLQREARTNLAGTANVGGNLIDTDFMRFVDFLHPNSPVTNLCDVNDNLEGNLIFPVESTVPSLQWASEVAASTKQTPQFTQVTSSPTRAHITVEMSRRLLVQEHSNGIQNRLTRQMNRAFSTGVENALLVGTGANSQPTGIMTALNASAQVVGVPTHKKLIDLFELVLANADALQGRLAYVTTPAVHAFLKATVLDAGSGRFLADGKLNESTTSNGYPVLTTTVMPLFTAKHGMVFGNFEDVTLNFWGGPVLIVNPYTKMKESIIEIYMERQMDVKVVRNASFAISKDIVFA